MRSFLENPDLQSFPDGVVIYEPEIFYDVRGHFFESFNASRRELDLSPHGFFVQDNQSLSRKGVVRGMHYQSARPQGKLISVVSGTVFDVFVDLRVESKFFGQVYSLVLDDVARKHLFLPPGFAHGFQALEDNTILTYKVTDFFDKRDEKSISVNCPKLNIKWPLAEQIISDKDLHAPSFAEALGLGLIP